DEAAVLLDGQNLAAVFDEQLGERTEARTDFEHFVAFFQISGLDDFAKLVGVMKEILPQGPGELNLVLFQNLLHFRELHAGVFFKNVRTKNTETEGHPETVDSNTVCANALTADRSCFSEIVSGGVRLMTFECSPSGKRM